MKIYAAVIEWPDGHATEPGLILAATGRKRDLLIAAEIQDVADDLTDPDWRDAIDSTGSNDWSEWLTAIDTLTDDRPTVTLYEKEIR